MTSPIPVSELRPRLGISSCLLGQEVRFDAGHKRDAYVTGTLAGFFDFVPVCPEVAIGLGIPREPIRLVGDPADPRAVGTRRPNLDVTHLLQNYGRDQAALLTDISGFIFKRKSPSCGMERVKVYPETGSLPKPGTGLFAKEIMKGQPLLPVEEEGRLGDPMLRENFIERVFAYKRWQDLLFSGLTPGGLLDFHTEHKLILMSHGEVRYRALGRLVAQLNSRPLSELANEYIQGFMEHLRQQATRKRHTDVLQHLMGYLKRHLEGDDKAEILEVLDAYRLGRVPLIVPVTLLKHHFRRYPDPYIQRQLYLNPHPKELMLRNSI